MAGGASAHDASEKPQAPKVMGKATVDTLRVGCVAMVWYKEKGQDGEYREAEILSIKEKKSGRHFYVYFVNFNKRLDDWVPASKIDFTQDVAWPSTEKQKEKKAAAPVAKKTIPLKKGQKRPLTVREPSVASETSIPQIWDESQKPTPEPEDDPQAKDGTNTPDVQDEDVTMLDNPLDGVPQEENEYGQEEKDRLRVGGSMTQNQAELNRIRNISKVQFGKYELNPWYFSPYPESFSQEDLMFICEFCLNYFADPKSFQRHRQKCTLQHPPGNEIYRDDYVSFFEIDGRRQRIWCRNLCLLSKLFLDHKTLYYDVDPFLFYVMTARDEKGFHLVGYFSKEKECAEGYNVACILTMPQYQRKGYGRLLIQFSYELTRLEGKVGSPEKPLSDLGLLSYRKYWFEQLMGIILKKHSEGKTVSIDDLAHELAMTPIDVEGTLAAYKMQAYHGSQHKIIIPNSALLEYQTDLAKKISSKTHVIDAGKISWKPPVFSASSRTWGW